MHYMHNSAVCADLSQELIVLSTKSNWLWSSVFWLILAGIKSA